LAASVLTFPESVPPSQYPGWIAISKNNIANILIAFLIIIKIYRKTKNKISAKRA